MDEYDKYLSDDAPDAACEKQLSEKESGENMPKKYQLLEKYLDRPVTAFRQYDCFIDAVPDCMVQPDTDGDCLFGGSTHELMHGASVRVLIRIDESKKDVVRALLKIVDSINRNDKFESKADEEIPF